jgi:hypothetical protein
LVIAFLTYKKTNGPKLNQVKAFVSAKCTKYLDEKAPNHFKHPWNISKEKRSVYIANILLLKLLSDFLKKKKIESKKPKKEKNRNIIV